MSENEEFRGTGRDFIKRREGCQRADDRWLKGEKQRIADRYYTDISSLSQSIVDDGGTIRVAGKPLRKLRRLCRPTLSGIVKDDAGSIQSHGLQYRYSRQMDQDVLEFDRMGLSRMPMILLAFTMFL